MDIDSHAQRTLPSFPIVDRSDVGTKKYTRTILEQGRHGDTRKKEEKERAGNRQVGVCGSRWGGLSVNRGAEEGREKTGKEFTRQKERWEGLGMDTGGCCTFLPL